MKLTRRDFVIATAISAGLAAAGCTRKPVPAQKPEAAAPVPEDLTWYKTVCRYCGVGCGVMAGVKDGKLAAVKGDDQNPVNRGLLCVKAYYLHKMQNAPDRIRKPLVRRDGQLVDATWDEALDLVGTTLSQIRDEFGPDALAYYGSGQALAEEAYVANKLFKGCIGTNNIEGNPRTCMASAVAGYVTTFGKDEPMGSFDDIEQCDTFFLIGTNTAECHPVVYSRITDHKQARAGVKIIIADPRRHRVHDIADLVLTFRPGTDMALLHAMAHVIVQERLADEAFIAAHVNCNDGTDPMTWEQYKSFLAQWTPEKAAGITGLNADDIRTAARWLGEKGKEATTMWCMGINQRVVGTFANNLIHNLHLITGKISRPGSGPFSLTGQPSACGSVREVGALSHLLPGHRMVANEKHRAEVTAIWGVAPEKIQPKPGLHMMDMFQGTVDGRVKGMIVACTNPGHSLPNVNHYRAGMEQAFLVVLDCFHNRTTELADVVLPAALWVEKEGIYGNSDRRTQHLAKAIDPPADARPDLWILLEIAKRMGYGPLFEHYTNNAAVWEEYRQLTRGGMDMAPYERYTKERGLRWPVKDDSSTGTLIRFAHPWDPYVTAEEKVKFYGKPDGKAVVFARPYQGPQEDVDAEYPFYLSTGRVLEHWHTITMTGRCEELVRAVPDFYCELHPDDAASLGIRTGDTVRITSRRGSIAVPARVGGRGEPQKGMVFTIWHEPELARLSNIVTNDAVDPTSKQPEYKVCAVKVEKA